MTYTPDQIRTAKKLVRWYKTFSTPEDSARIEVAQLLKRYEHKKIKNAMNSTACTSPLMLKKILEQRETFKDSKTYL